MQKEHTKPKEWADYAFCLIIGSVFIYALTRTIFAATLIRLPQPTLVTMGIASIILTSLVFFNKVTRIISLVVITFLSLYILRLFYISTYYDMHPWIEHFHNLFLMIGGSAPFDPALGRTIAWVVSMLLAALVVIFMFYKFSFYILALTGASVFVFSWGPGFARDERAFLLFLFAFCVLLIRKMNGSVSVAFRIAPLCALAIWIINVQLPTNSDFFVRRTINETLNLAMENLSDRMFELFNPTYFSFQSTGFSGAGGRLGGPVTLNNRTVMDVAGPGGIYLAGAVSNTYTGYSWIPTLEEGAINTHGLPPGQFEMLETAAALIRGATIAHERASISAAAFSGIVTSYEHRDIFMRDFSALGVVASNPLAYYLHTYMPFDTVAISMGRQRTGTVFRPITAWGLEFTVLGLDYLPVTAVLPTGDKQTPGLMSRNTAYQMQFLNINPQLSFVEYLLQQASTGVYSRRENNDNWWQNTTFSGEVVGLVPGAYSQRWLTDPRSFLWSETPPTLVHIDDIVLGEHDYIRSRIRNHMSGIADYVDEIYVHRSFESFERIFIPLEFGDIEEVASLSSYYAYYNDESFQSGTLRMELPGVLAMDIHLYGDDVFEVPDWFISAHGVEVFAMPDWVVYRYEDGERIYGRIEFGDIITINEYFPMVNYWQDSRISTDALYFESITYFGVEEMQALVEMLSVASLIGLHELQYIPREAYLLHWLDMFAANILAEYAYQVRQNFMGVPATVPQRVHDLTMQIVEDATTDFDRVMAIRDFLLQFPYTLTPVDVPRGVCFVDHFLFEGREGYCTYFASAMAIMARIAGVPSRYVEGFVLPPSRNQSDTIVVTNRMAHAWVEVYLEGFGWLIVEATPPYAGITSDVPLPQGGEFTPGWTPTGDRVGDPELEMYYLMNYRIPGGGFPTTGTMQEITEEAPAARVHNVINLAIALPVLIGVCILIYLLIKFWYVIYALFKIRRLAPNQQVIAYFAGILDIVTYYTTPLITGETPLAYGVHKGKRFAFKSDSVFFKDLIALYYKAKYSPHEITEAERAVMEEAYFDMVKLLRSQRLPFVFMYLRYIRRVGIVSTTLPSMTI